jgi:hypothetical protein
MASTTQRKVDATASGAFRSHTSRTRMRSRGNRFKSEPEIGFFYVSEDGSQVYNGEFISVLPLTYDGSFFVAESN